MKPVLWSAPPSFDPVARPTLFLDRDGVLIVDCNYLNDPTAVQLIPGAADALVRLRKAGWLIAVVTNQSGIARGLITREQLTAVHERLEELLADAGSGFDVLAYCPHGPLDGCNCRKPCPGMLDSIAQHLTWAVESSVVIGDKRSDLDLASRAGLKPILVRTGYGAQTEITGVPSGTVIFEDLAAAVTALVEPDDG